MKTQTSFNSLVWILLTLAFVGCSNAVKEPQYERNPNPRQKYTVTAKIGGAPGPFNYALASVRYKVGPTQECMPATEPFTGHSPTPSRFDITPKLKRISDTEYQFEVFLDAMARKDYFGKGVCDWVIETANLYLAASSGSKDRSFVASLLHSDFASKQPKVLYARRALYAMPVSHPHERFDDALDLAPVVKLYGPELSKFFTITLQIKEEGHDDQ